MRKVILLILIFLSIMALGLRFGTQPLMQALKLEERAGLKVESNKIAKVIINGKEVGTTPFQDENLRSGEHLVSLKSKEATEAGQFSWQGYVKLNSGTWTVVNRELTFTQGASSGEVITLEKGQGVTVVSNPSSAYVFMDGKEIGRTPLAISDVKISQHLFLISKENFLKRSIRATLIEGYNLSLAVDLAIDQVDLTKIPTIPLSSSSQLVVKSTPTGFLRVRSSPDLNSSEVARVTPGDTLILLEEVPNWQRIRLSDGKEGYVSSVYTEKKTQ